MKNKILMIDDDTDILRSFQVILESKGFEVIIATDGESGFKKLKEENPALVVLDVMMNSDLEGYNLLHEIRKQNEYKNLPVIMMTGIRDQLGVNLTSAVEDEAMFPGVSYLEKPVDPDILSDMIKNMIK